MLTFLNRTRKLIQIARTSIALRKADNDGDRERARLALANLFADARGVTMKIGQMFSEVGGNSAFDQLAKGVDPYPLSTMLPELVSGMGRPVAEVFQDIEGQGIAASLGQVHKGRLLNGDEVAIKIRYPKIASAVQSEMAISGMIPKMGPAKKWGIDLDGYKQILKDNMDRELDYRTEADRQIAYGETVNVAGLCVPEVYSGLCSEEVLVQRWEDGLYLDEVVDWPEKDRLEISQIILKTFFYSLFVAGEMHGDPHLGNSLYRRNEDGEPEMVLLDYGCTIAISSRQRLALLELILACRDGGDIPAYECFVDMGFDAEKLSHIQDTLPEISKIILKPFIGDGEFDSNTWDINQGFIDLLGDLKWWFRSAGPPGLFLAIRAFHGVISQLERLQCSLSWWNVLQDSIGGDPVFEASKRLAVRRMESGNEALNTNANRDKPKALAEYLRIRVTENAEEIVSIAMPGGAAYNLIDLMPEDVIAYIRETGEIDLESIVAKVEETEAAPQVLLDLDRGAKHYRVWLE